jgi:hypothetical protein
MVGTWDWQGTIACVVLAVVGVAVSGWGCGRDIAR